MNEILGLEKKLVNLKNHQEFIGFQFIIRSTERLNSKNLPTLSKSIRKKATYMWEQHKELYPILEEFEHLLKQRIYDTKELERFRY